MDGKEDIASYVERMELYDTFIAFIVSDAYGVLRNLLAPENPKYVFCAIVCNVMFCELRKTCTDIV